MVHLWWSKNVHKERDVPYQIVLGAIDPKYCILLVLASFLEKRISFGDGQLSEFLFGKVDQTPENLNNNSYGVLKKHVLDNEEFVWVVVMGNLGTDSFKKFGTAHPCWCGIGKDDVDMR
eukprot:752559-Ditylum_brightwellii.AAC.1